ncbi:MAG: hypothetical protein AAF206_26920 [Bacteroidota bacterium]
MDEKQRGTVIVPKVEPGKIVLKLWVRWRPEFKFTAYDTYTYENSINPSQKQSKMDYYQQKALKFFNEKRIWEAKIFEFPGNHTLWAKRVPFKNQQTTEFR